MNYKKKYKFLLFAILSLFGISIIILFIFTENIFLGNEFQKNILTSELKNTKYKEQRIMNIINDTKNTLSNIQELKTFQNALKSNNFDALNNLFQTISQSNRYFMQLRYIDKNGLERVRIDRIPNKDKVIVIPKEKLQNKAHRNYFIDSKNKRDFLVSNLDLNQEHHKIDYPYNPTVRIILPIKDEKQEYNGILIVNLAMKLLLKSEIFNILIIDTHQNIILPTNNIMDKKEFITYFKDQKDAILKQKTFQGENFISYKMDNIFKNNIIVIASLKDIYIKNLLNDKLNSILFICIIVSIISFFIGIIIFKLLNNLFERYTTLEKLNHKLKCTNEELKKTNTLLTNDIDPHLILSQSDTSMILTGPLEEDNPIIYANNAFYTLYGYTQKEILGKNPRFLNNEDREQKALLSLKEAIKEQKPITTVIRNYTKNGELKYIELTISPIFDKRTKEIKYFLGIHKDVTKEQKLLKDIQELF